MYGGVRMTRLMALGLVLELILAAAAIWAGISLPRQSLTAAASRCR